MKSFKQFFLIHFKQRNILRELLETKVFTQFLNNCLSKKCKPNNKVTVEV